MGGGLLRVKDSRWIFAFGSALCLLEWFFFLFFGEGGGGGSRQEGRKEANEERWSQGDLSIY